MRRVIYKFISDSQLATSECVEGFLHGLQVIGALMILGILFLLVFVE